MTDKTNIETQDKGRVEMLSEVAIKQRLRPLVPRAIERLKDLMESRNEAIAMGAAKLVLNKFLADLKATEISTPTEKPLQITLDIKGVDQNELHRAGTVSTETVVGV